MHDTCREAPLLVRMTCVFCCLANAGAALAQAAGPSFLQPTSDPPFQSAESPSKNDTFDSFQGQIVDVQTEGNVVTPTTKILQAVSTRPNRAFDQALLENDVRVLFAKGWFVDVKVRREVVPGGVKVTFVVAERPRLKYVKYLGNKKIKTTRLAKETDLKKGNALDPYAVEEARRKLQTYYETKGFNDVQITILEGNRVTDKGAVFLINEGVSQKIAKVQFEGNTIATDSRLKTQVQTKPPILWVFKGSVDRKKIDEDVDKLTVYYRSLGFFKARVGRELDYDNDKEWLTVTYVIDEGPRYVVNSVTFAGNAIFTSEQFRAQMKLLENQFFDQPKLTADVNTIQDIYGSQGYVFAKVESTPSFYEEPGKLDLVYKVTEGDQYRVGKINVHIAGDHPHTRHATALNRFSLKPGDIIDVRQLRASERRLKASGLFLNDATKGVSPHIDLGEPNDLEAIAKGSSGKQAFRGQSPDQPVVRMLPAGTARYRPGVLRLIDGSAAFEADVPGGPTLHSALNEMPEDWR